MKRIVLSIAVLVGTNILFPVSPAAAQPSFEQIVKKAEAKFEPADAKPGQTVTLKVTLQLLDGWHTYPLFQPDKAAKTYINKITFPEAGPLVYVGELNDPKGAKEKAEPLASIERMLVYPGGATWEFTAVVLPTTKAGPVSSKIKFRVLVCDKDNCVPPTTIDIEATLKVAGEPVKVDPKYQKDVDKALKK